MSDDFDAAVAKTLGQMPAAPASAEPTEQDFDAAVAGGLNPDQGRAARAGFALAYPTNPDAYAEAQRVARRANLPVETVLNNPAQARQQVALGSIDFDTLGKTSPATAALLADIEKAKVAHDDVDSLTGIESAVGSLARYVTGADPDMGLWRDVAAAPFSALKMGAGVARAGVDLLALPERGINALTGAGRGPLQAWGDSLGETARWAGQRAEDIGSHWSPGSLPGQIFGAGATSGVQSAGMTLGTLALASWLLGPEAGIPMTIAALSAGQGGSSYQESREKGRDVLPSLAYGAEDAVAEYVGERYFGLAGFAQRAFAGATVQKLLGYELFREVPGEIGTQLWQNFNEWTNLNPDKSLKDFLAEQPASVAQTVVATLTGGSMQIGTVKLADQLLNAQAVQERKARFSELQAQQLEALTSFAAASKLAARAPDTFEQFIAQAAEEGPVSHVFISADALMQSGVADQITAISPSVAAQAATAEATGGQIAIPVEEFAARIAPTEYAQGLLDHLKTDPEGFSRAEAQTHLQTRDETLAAEFERAAAQQGNDEAFSASADAVRADLKAQLDTAGRFTPQTNDAYATLAGSWYAVQAARLGTTPEDLYQRYPLRVVAQGVAGGLTLDQKQSAPVAALTGEEIAPRDADIKTLRAQAKEWYAGNLAGTVVHNSQLGDVQFSNRGLRKMLSSSANPAKLKLVSALPQIIANGALVRSLDNRNTDTHPNIVRYHWLQGNVLLDGKNLTVEVNVEEHKDGKLYYNHTLPGNEYFQKGVQARNPSIPGVISPAERDSADGEHQSEALGSEPPATSVEQNGDDLNLQVLDQPARGSFAPSTLTISLLKDADLSTFLHETGHFFLEAQADLADQPDAPAAIRQDMQTVLDWFGVPDLAAWQAMDLEQKRPYHEQFARGFEAYLFEGKAPSIELHGLFQRFRAWLLNIYKKLSALNVALSDDVRGVFDRMLATGEQIALAEQGRSMLPLFETAEQAGMSQEEFAAYQALGVDATADAIEDLQTRGLRDMRWLHNARGKELKRLQKEVAARRAEVRQEVAQEVEALPVYRAWRYLTAKAEGDTPPPRLSRAVLDEMYGGAVDGKRDRYALLDWKRLTDLRMTAEEGLPPDIVAELHGFSSGDELVRALLAAERPEAEIEARTDARMLEQYGDIASPEALARAADQAIHNDARARFTATEANALARATGKRKILLDAAREFARVTISRLRVRDVRPGQYANAEARATQNAERAVRSGDLATAAAEKRNQVVQQQLTRAAYRAQEDIDKTLRYLKKFDSAGVRKNLDTDFLDQIDMLLERFDLRQRSDAERARAAGLRTWVQSRLNAGEIPDIAETLLSPAERARYLAAVQSRDANGDLIYADDDDAIKLLAEAIDNSAQRHYRDLTVEELMGLRDTISGIEHLARLKHRLLTAANDRDYEAVRDEIAAGIAAHASASGKNTRTASSLSGRALEAVRAFGAEHIKASTWARIMDGGQDDGPVWRYLIRPANEAANHETQMKAELVQRLDAIIRPIMKTVPATDKGGSGRSFPSIGESLNWQERFAVALNVGNESNLQRLLDGRGWTMAQIQPVLESLTAQELHAVQAVWDLFEAYRPQVAEQERRIYGKEPEWVRVRPITIRSADGQAVQLTGGYYPVKFDPRVNMQAGQHSAAEESKTKTKAAYGVATTRRSFTKTRVEEVKGRPLLLNLQGMYSGFSDVIHGLAWQEWVIDANKLLRSKTIDTAIREYYGPEVKHELERWRDDIVMGASRQNTAFEKTVGFVRQNVSAAALSFQVFTAAMQPLGLANSVARVGGSWIAKGVGRYIGAPVASTREAMSKSTFLANRTRTRFRELNELRNQVQGQSSAKEFMGRWGYWLMMRTQMMIDVPTWWGAYEKALADGRTEDTAVALADQAVKDAQGGGEEVDQAGIERGGALQKLFTAFYSYMGSTLNTMYASAKVDSKGKAAANILLMVLVPAVLQSLLKHAMTPGGDDDWDDWLKSLPAEIASFMAGLMVFVRELDPFVKAVAGEGGMGYGGPAGLRMIGDIGRLGQQINQGEFDLAFGKAFINVLGDLTGLPSVQINRTLTGVDALASGKTQNPAALLMGVQR